MPVTPVNGWTKQRMFCPTIDGQYFSIREHDTGDMKAFSMIVDQSSTPQSDHVSSSSPPQFTTDMRIVVVEDEVDSCGCFLSLTFEQDYGRKLEVACLAQILCVSTTVGFFNCFPSLCKLFSIYGFKLRNTGPKCHRCTC